jgi:hypothetical protein
MPPKRKHLNLKQKKQLITDNDVGKTIDGLVQKFDASKSGAYNIIGERKSIMEQFENRAECRL